MLFKFVTMALFLCGVSAWSQDADLIITTIDGRQQSINIDTIRNLSFPGNETGALVIRNGDGSVQHTTLTQIKSIKFSVASQVVDRGSAARPISILTLEQNYPNPFNPTTTIEFTLFEPAPTRAFIVNIQGRLVRTLMHNAANPGTYRILWDGKDDSGERVSSGVYFYSVVAGQHVQVKKCVFVE